MSDSSSPPTRRSPFAAFTGEPTQGPRAASHGGTRRRSRSPHGAPDVAFEAASDGRLTAAIKHLEATIDQLEKQRADDRKWLMDNARRLDQVESQVREQTLEAKAYAREKCSDVDGRIQGLRVELDAKVPKLLIDSETKITETLIEKIREATSSIHLPGAAALRPDTKMSDRIQAIEDAMKMQLDEVKKHADFLNYFHNNTPEDAQGLAARLKFIDEELINMKTVMMDPAHKQKIMDDTKQVMHDALKEYKADYDSKFGQVAGSTIISTGQIEQRINGIETMIAMLQSAAGHTGLRVDAVEMEVMVTKSAVACLQGSPGYVAASGLQGPPGYAGAGGHPINMRAAYGGCGGYGGPGDSCNDGHQHSGPCGAGRGGFPAGGGLAQAGRPGPCHCDHVDRLMLDMGAAQNDIRRLLAGRAPLIPPDQPASQQQEPTRSSNDHVPATAGSPAMDLPLILGHLGNISSDRIFDDKVSVHEDFRFNGHKNGYAWKSKVERYMISRVPALAKIF